MAKKKKKKLKDKMIAEYHDKMMRSATIKKE